MSSITAIILTFNEQLHIERCIRSLNGVVTNILIVDSFSTDNTVSIAESLGAKVVQRKWKNYSDQFQWGIDHATEILGQENEWVMRMDADEYFEPALTKELSSYLAGSPSVTGIYLKRKVYFKDKFIRFGGFYPHILLRLWRNGQGRIEQRWMDEHIVLNDDKTVILKNHIVDHNLNNIGWWVEKHNNYATREAIDLLNIKYDFTNQDDSLKNNDDPQAKLKRIMKEELYSRLPTSLRSSLYFIYRYLFRAGFLDGKQGFIFHFLQGFWYRLLVDIKYDEMNKLIISKPDKTKQDILKIIEDYSGYKIK